MRILFECRNCGLGNNGGTSTIIKSANALVNLGHEVTLIDDQKKSTYMDSINCKTFNP